MNQKLILQSCLSTLLIAKSSKLGDFVSYHDKHDILLVEIWDLNQKKKKIAITTNNALVQAISFISIYAFRDINSIIQ